MKRPKIILTQTEMVKTGCGNAYITYSVDPAYACEIFGVLGKPGGCARALMEGLTRVITVARKHGTPDDLIIKQLKGIRCPQDSNFIPSCPEAIAQIMEKIQKEKGEKDGK